MRKKASVGNVKFVGMNLLVLGVSLSENAIDQIKRASDKGLVIRGSKRLAEELKSKGIKVKAFDDQLMKNLLMYPKTGLPTNLVEAITATTTEDLVKLPKDSTIHVVFTELERMTDGLEDKTVSHNITDALSKAIQGGRIPMTNVDQLEAFLDISDEKKEISEEVYYAIGTRNAATTWQALESHYRAVANYMASEVKSAETVLEQNGIEVEA